MLTSSTFSSLAESNGGGADNTLDLPSSGVSILFLIRPRNFLLSHRHTENIRKSFLTLSFRDFCRLVLPSASAFYACLFRITYLFFLRKGLQSRCCCRKSPRSRWHCHHHSRRALLSFYFSFKYIYINNYVDQRPPVVTPMLGRRLSANVPYRSTYMPTLTFPIVGWLLK